MEAYGTESESQDGKGRFSFSQVKGNIGRETTRETMCVSSELCGVAGV